MAKYYDVRGFLDCDYGDLDVIRNIVAGYTARGSEFFLEDDIVALYLSGWLYQTREINWVAHAFFGASMRHEGVDLVLDQLRRIAEALPEAEGTFFVDDDEDLVSRRWDVADGAVSISERGSEDP